MPGLSTVQCYEITSQLQQWRHCWSWLSTSTFSVLTDNVVPTISHSVESYIELLFICAMCISTAHQRGDVRASNEKRVINGPWVFVYWCMVTSLTNDPAVFLPIYLGEQKGDYLALNIHIWSFKMSVLLGKEFPDTDFSIMVKLLWRTTSKLQMNKICKTRWTVKVQNEAVICGEVPNRGHLCYNFSWLLWEFHPPQWPPDLTPRLVNWAAVPSFPECRRAKVLQADALPVHQPVTGECGEHRRWWR